MNNAGRKTVAILGAGPAGCATAIALLRTLTASRQSLNVILLDAVATPQEVPVGETVPPAATPVLGRLGCEDLLESGDHLECPGSASVWGDDRVGHNDFLFSPVGKGFHLDRKKFDADLQSRAASLGCNVKRGWRLRRVRKHGHRFALTFLTQNSEATAVPSLRGAFREDSLLADFVVDASGISGAFTRRVGVARNVFDEVISVCAFFEVPVGDSRAPARTLVQTQENGWWYAARIPDGKAIISFCTDAHELNRCKFAAAAAKWRKYFDQSSWLAGECEKQFGATAGPPSRVVLKPAPSAILSAVVGDAWLAVGDAASSYDSFTSAGITKALSNGEIAGRAVASCLTRRDREPVREYQDGVFADFRRYVQLHRYHYRNEPRYAHAGFWRRRVADHRSL